MLAAVLPSTFPSILSRQPRSSLFSTFRIVRPSMAFRGDPKETKDAGDASPACCDCSPAPRRTFHIVVAATTIQQGIGKDGSIPWKLPCDMKFFKRISSFTASLGKRNAVIMGRRTWESIPVKFQPLPGRLNVILTRRRDDLGIHTESQQEQHKTLICDSLDAALTLLATSPYDACVANVFVIGGSQVYREAMESPNCDAIHITEIDSSYDCDTFIPCIDPQAFHLWYLSIPAVENRIRYSFVTYIRVVDSKDKNSTHRLMNNSNGVISCDVAATDVSARLPEFILEKHEKYQYLNLIHDIIDDGVEKGDRTGTGTFSKFGWQVGRYFWNDKPVP